MGTNLIKKVIPFVICILLVGVSIPVTKSAVVNNSVNSNSLPSLKIKILNQISLFSLYFTITNNGTITLHNIRYSGMTISGYVIYNSEPKLLITDLEPGDSIVALSDRFVGFGIFIAKISIICDGGYNDTDYVNGLVFGPLNFVP
jgi:hypothetical protein